MNAVEEMLERLWGIAIIGLLAAAILAIAAMIASSADAQMACIGEDGDGLPRPETSPTVMDGSDKLSEWFSFHWACEGFAMPKWGEIFTWDRYLTKVQDGVPHQWDAVYWDNGDGDDKASVGMVSEEPESMQEPVTVESPMPGGLFILVQAVERSRIIGFLRPKQKL